MLDQCETSSTSMTVSDDGSINVSLNEAANNSLLSNDDKIRYTSIVPIVKTIDTSIVPIVKTHDTTTNSEDKKHIILKDQKPPSPSNSKKRISSNDDNVVVVAQGWTKRIVNRINDIRKDASYLSESHSLSGQYYYKLQTYIAVPAILTPSICSPIVALLASIEDSCDSNIIGIAPSAILGTISLAITSALTTVMSLFKWGDRSREHHTFAAKYKDLVTTIVTEMARSRQFRRNVDQFLVECQMRFDIYASSEPVIPQRVETKMLKTKMCFNYSKSG